MACSRTYISHDSTPEALAGVGLRRWIARLALMMLLTGLAAAQDPGRVEGVVRDAQTAAPVYGAQVQLKAEAGDAPVVIVQTDRDGRYGFEEIPGGLYSITWVAFPYERTQADRVRVRDGRGTTRDVELAPHPRRAAWRARLYEPLEPRPPEAVDVVPIPLRPGFAERWTPLVRVRPVVAKPVRIPVMPSVVNLDDSPIRWEARSVRAINEILVEGKTLVTQGELVNYRARFNFTASRPIEADWDFGDGITAVGNNVVHRYTEPGQYLVTLLARNAIGSVRDTLLITVAGQGSASVSSHTGLRGPGEFDFRTGGYTWIVRTLSYYPDARDLVAGLRERGYKSSIWFDPASENRAVYRVIVGQFATREAAMLTRNEARNLAGGQISLGEVAPAPALP